MGLDMYLYAERSAPGLTTTATVEDDEYVAGYDFQPADERRRYRDAITLAGLAAQADAASPHATIRVKGVTPPPFGPRTPLVDVCVGYWRKANQIHGWFVDHVQGGEDRCQSTPVTRAQLEELRNECQYVLGSTRLVPGQVVRGVALHMDGTYGVREEPMLVDGQQLYDTRIAMDRLPTREGFFFGGTAYDEGYWRDLEDTIVIITRALSAPEDTTFSYHASW
jgi:hypothetical protein